MVRFCTNVSMLFAEVPFLDRFERSRAAGFDAVEFQFPYDFAASDIRAKLDQFNLELVLFNLPAGDFAAGDRGMASDPSRLEDFQASVELALSYARILRPQKINCLAGKRMTEVGDETQRATLIDNLRYAADAAASEGVQLMIEPLNPYDAPGFYLPKPSDGFSVVAEAAHQNLTVEYDIYHAQRTEGNIVTAIMENLAAIGHIQLADSPGRNEPGTGELNWGFIFRSIDEMGYGGRIGLEFRPSTPRTEDSLNWIGEFR